MQAPVSVIYNYIALLSKNECITANFQILHITVNTLFIQVKSKNILYKLGLGIVLYLDKYVL